MLRHLAIVLSSIAITFAATANQWQDVHPIAPSLALGGSVVDFSVSPDGTQYVLSEFGNSFKRNSSSEAWVEFTPMLASGMKVEPRNRIFDESNPSHIIADTSASSFPNGSIIVSLDGGNIWERPYWGVIDGPGLALSGAAASDPNVLYAWADLPNEIARSNDGGQTWAFTSSDDMTDLRSLVIHPNNPDVLYALDSSIIKKSTDAGLTWEIKDAGTGSFYYMTKLVMDPQDPDTLYALSGAFGRVYKSTNAAESWSQLSSNFGPLDDLLTALLFDSQQENVLYAVSRSGGVFVSQNGGVNWQVYGAERSYGRWFGVEQTADNELTLGGETGVAVASIAGGVLDSNSGLSNFRTWSFTCGGVGCEFQYGSSRESGAIYNTPATSNWQLMSGGFDHEITSVTLDPQNPEHVFINSDDGLWESQNGGASWEALALPQNWFEVRNLYVSPTDSSFLFAQSSQGVSVSNDGGATWTESLPPSAVNQCCGAFPMVISPVNNDYVVMGSPGSGIYRSTDGGLTWSIQNVDGPGIWGTAALQMDPRNPDRLVLVDNNDEIWESADFGESWGPFSAQGINTSLYDSELVIDNFIEGRIFLMDGVGIVYLYSPNSETWSQITPEGVLPGGCGYECSFIADENFQGRFYSNLNLRHHQIDIDSDLDGVIESQDNCTLIANNNQRDTDGDSFGNICDPDLNNDSVVNFIDLSIMASLYLSNDPDADLNGDGFVNFSDVFLLRTYFFKSPGPGAQGL